MVLLLEGRGDSSGPVRDFETAVAIFVGDPSREETSDIDFGGRAEVNGKERRGEEGEISFFVGSHSCAKRPTGDFVSRGMMCLRGGGGGAMCFWGRAACGGV